MQKNHILTPNSKLNCMYMIAHIWVKLKDHIRAAYDHICTYMICTYMILCSYMMHIYVYSSI